MAIGADAVSAGFAGVGFGAGAAFSWRGFGAGAGAAGGSDRFGGGSNSADALFFSGSALVSLLISLGGGEQADTSNSPEQARGRRNRRKWLEYIGVAPPLITGCALPGLHSQPL